jgi:hypothetical protein
LLQSVAAEPSVLIHEQPNTSFGGGIPSVGEFAQLLFGLFAAADLHVNRARMHVLLDQQVCQLLCNAMHHSVHVSSDSQHMCTLACWCAVVAGLDGIAHPGMSAAEAADFSAAADIAAAAAYDGLVGDPAAAAAVAAGLPNMLLYGNPLQPQQLHQQQLDPAAAAAATVPDPGSDYTQTTTITEVPCMATPGAGGSMPRVPSQQRVPMAAGATTVITPGGATTTMHAAGTPAATAAAAGGGVQVLSPLEFKVESPTAAAAAAAAGAGAAMHVDAQQPKVDSPEGDLDMGMNEILSNLSHMNITDLMMTDEMSKDDLWDMLFGQQQGSGPMLSGHSFGANSGDMGAAVAGLGAGGSAAAAASPVGAAVGSSTLQ